MADPNFAPIGDDSSDDLPRTFRREKEAREREARERAARERAAAPTLSTTPIDAPVAPAPRIYAEPAGPVTATLPGALQPATVKRLDIPFGHLVAFFLKAIVAAIPALIMLMFILWGFGQALSTFFPDLARMKILIGFGG